MAEGGYADISGGFNPAQHSLQAILALLQQQGGAQQEGMSADMPSSLRPIEPYSTPKPLTSARGIEMAMPPEQMPFMAAPYAAPQQAERTGQVSQTTLQAKPGLQSMMSASDMGVLGGGKPMSSNSRSFAPQNYGGGVVSLNQQTPAQSTAPPAQAKAASQPYVSSYWKNVDKVVASNDKRNAKFAATFAKSLR